MCKLKKASYGLKQAGHKQQKLLTMVMMNNLGFKHSVVDHLVYFRHSGDEHTIITVATDDMVVISKRLLDVIKFKSEIRQHFEIANCGKLQGFLGFEIRRD